LPARRRGVNPIDLIAAGKSENQPAVAAAKSDGIFIMVVEKVLCPPNQP